MATTNVSDTQECNGFGYDATFPKPSNAYSKSSAIAAIVAGNSLKGKVVLNVQRKLPPGELVLRLVGTEYTIIPTRKGTRQV